MVAEERVRTLSDRHVPGEMEIFMAKSSNEIREVSSIHMITVSF